MCQCHSTWNNPVLSGIPGMLGNLSACVNSGYFSRSYVWLKMERACANSGYLEIREISRGSMPPDSPTVNKCRAVMLFTPANNVALPDEKKLST